MERDFTEFNIKPNAGFQRDNWKWLLAILVIVSLLIALRFAWLGFWMILPFTLIELGILIVLMEMVKRRGSYVEKVTISHDSVEVFHLQSGNNKDWAFPLYWTRVELKKPSHQWYPHKLLVGASGVWIEIGQCLTDEERIGLADAIGSEIKRCKTAAGPDNA